MTLESVSHKYFAPKVLLDPCLKIVLWYKSKVSFGVLLWPSQLSKARAILYIVCHTLYIVLSSPPPAAYQ